MEQDKWDGKTVVVQEIWGLGGELWLKSAVGSYPTFKLKRADDFAGNVLPTAARYEVTFEPGCMVETWRSVWLLRVEDVPGRTEDSLPCQRLEGFMPVIFDGQPRVDRVQMVYQDAGQGDAAQDLVTISLAFGDGGIQPNEDGGGSGPPH